MSKHNQTTKLGFKIKHDGYFMLRRPLLSLDTLDRILQTYWRVDPASAGAIVQELLANEKISSSVRLATPGLHDRLRRQTTPEKSLSQLTALMRYVVRMSTRSTPFGAFASVGLGHIGNVSQDIVDEDVECRLAMDCAVLLGIDEKLRKTLVLQQDMRVRKTRILYSTKEHIRFIERKLKNEQYSFELARISRNDYLDRVLSRAARPVLVRDLLSDLTDFDNEISCEMALDYISGLVENGVLELDFGMRTIGKAPLDSYLRDLGSAVPGSAGQTDVSMLKELSSIIRSDEPCSPDAAAARVDAAEACLKAHGVAVTGGKSIHIDTFANSDAASISEDILPPLEATLMKLRQIFPHVRSKALTEFIDAFERRFSDDFIPVMAALDPETGISFGYSTASVSWTRSLGTIAKRQGAQPAPESVLSEALLANLMVGKRVIDLADIRLGSGTPDTPVVGFPKDFSVNITVFDTTDTAPGAPSMFLNGVSAEGSTNLMTRFAARHDDFASAIRRSVCAESEKYEDTTILAEIVHLPGLRASNVLPRPAVRDYEIVLSGMGSADIDHQIQVDDLFIGVVNNEVILWSRRLDKRVIPYLSSAHYFVAHNNLALYQFFCLIATQSSSAPNFKWPQSLLAFPFLPRVQCGSVLVARARWNIKRQQIDEIRRLISLGAWGELKKVFADLALPRWFAIEQNDNILEIDSGNELSLHMLSDELAAKSHVVFTESPARLGKPKFGTHDQKWHSEIIVPLHTPSVGKQVKLSGLKHLVQDEHAARTPVSGGTHRDDCYYVKIYGGEDYLDAFLAETLGPLIQAGMQQGAVENWFFVRYRDPEYHLRIRLFGKRPALLNFAHALVDRYVTPRVCSHEIANVIVDTYKPEHVRYGGRQMMPLIEKLFSIDSDYALAIRKGCINDSNDDKVWKAALSGAMRYIEDFGLSVEDKTRLIQTQRDGFAAETDLDANQHRELGNLYKKHRAYIEDAVSVRRNIPQAINNALATRSSGMKALLDTLPAEISNVKKLDILGSLIHMQCNRLFLGAARSQEFVMWDFMLRANRSVNARINEHK